MACFCKHHLERGHGHEYGAGALLDGPPMPFAEPGVQPHYAPSRTARILHSSIRLRIEPELRSFQGEARIELEHLPTWEGTVVFDLAEVDVHSVRDADGNALPFETRDETLRVQAGDLTTVVIRWHGQKPTRGLYFTGPTRSQPDRQYMAWTQCQDEDGHYVFPCFDHPGVKHSWDIEIDAPAGYTILSNGRLVEVGKRKGRSYAVYEQKEPMPAYLFTAVVAKLHTTTAKWRDRLVRYLVPVGETEHVERAMGKTPTMLEVFSQLLGYDYPWSRYDQVVVHDFIFGGMENVACTTMTDLLLVDERGVQDWDPDGLVAHELAHQWFGDLVTCQDWSQAWLNESWATFMEVLWWEADRSRSEATWYRWTTAHEYLAEASGRYMRPIVSYDFREPIDVFDRHLYQKGACVLATLRDEIGEGAFWAGVHTYLGRHQHQTVHTRHFQRAMEDATGINLDRFFHQWIFSPGHPVVDVALGSDKNLVVATVKQTQSGPDVPEAYSFTLRLEIVFADGDTQVVDLPVAERERSWAVPVGKEVATVRVDPGFRVLAALSVEGPREWLKRLLTDECPSVAVRAARALMKVGTPPAIEDVADALRSHPSRHVRAEIASLLAKRGGPQSRDQLVTALGQETHPTVKRALATGLGLYRDEVAANALISILSGEPETWQLYAAALVALGKTRDPRAREHIEEHLDVPSWGDSVRQRALTGLAATEDPAVMATLLERSQPDWPYRLRAAAATALGTMGDKVESCRDAALERLVEMTAEPGFRPQLACIGALGVVGDPRAVPALSRVHRSAPDGRVRRAAYEALVKVRRGRTTEAGLAGLRSRFEALAEENAKLRARIDKLEQI